MVHDAWQQPDHPAKADSHLCIGMQMTHPATCTYQLDGENEGNASKGKIPSGRVWLCCVIWQAFMLVSGLLEPVSARVFSVLLFQGL